jgi:undecaprenyl-diphosphatase
MPVNYLLPLQRFLKSRLWPGHGFGLRLTVGLLALLAAGWVFSDIAAAVTSGAAITLLDVRLAGWFHTHASARLTDAMLVLTWMHSTTGILLLALLFVIWLYRRRDGYWVLATVLSVPGGMLLNVALKHVFRRARPHFADPLLTLPTYSFPSGHTAGATVLYGIVACYLVVHLRSQAGRAAVVAGAVAAVALVALSRMYLGVHYLSDVLAAVAEGCAWLAVCVTAVSGLRRHRAAARVQGSP